MLAKRFGAGVVISILAWGQSAQANVSMYSETLTLNQSVSNFLGVLGGTFTYAHSNPYQSVGGFSAAEFTATAAAGHVHSLGLTLDFSGINGLEWIHVQIATNGSGWNALGNITNNNPHTFDLFSPAFSFGASNLLGGLPVKIRVLGFGGWIGGSAMLESSSLDVGVFAANHAIATPIPGAVALAAFGLCGLLGVRKRNR